MGVLYDQILSSLTWSNLIVLFTATLGGMLVGATPGLTVIMAVALIIPFTLHLPLAPSLSLLLGVYISGIYGGSISSILLNTPGTPAAAATALDGYELAQQGKGRKALLMALAASVFGGLASVVMLIAVGPFLADFALKFGPAERATLLFMSLTVVGGLAGKSLALGLLSASLGLLLGAVGSDPIDGTTRLTFGYAELLDGFGMVPALIGLYAMSEILMQAETGFGDKLSAKKVRSLHEQQGLDLKDLSSTFGAILRGSAIGTFIGAMPGIGATVASFLGYGEARRASKHPELFGKGSLEGVAAAESANNAVSGATLIPLLTLSIPGDAVTAVLHSALLIQGVQTGPLIFDDHADAVYLIYITLILANACLAIVALGVLPFAIKVTHIPRKVLFPGIFILCIFGSFAATGKMFDVYVMLAFGMLAFIMRKASVPVAPLLIAMILARPFEEALRQALLGSGDNWSVFVSSPVAITCLAIGVLSIFAVARRRLNRGRP